MILLCQQQPQLRFNTSICNLVRGTRLRWFGKVTQVTTGYQAHKRQMVGIRNGPGRPQQTVGVGTQLAFNNPSKYTQWFAFWITRPTWRRGSSSREQTVTASACVAQHITDVGWIKVEACSDQLSLLYRMGNEQQFTQRGSVGRCVC